MAERYQQGTRFDASSEPNKIVQIDLHKGAESLRPLWIIEWERKAAEVAAAQPEVVKFESLPRSEQLLSEAVTSGIGMDTFREDAKTNGIGLTPQVIVFPSKISSNNENAKKAA